MVYNTKPLMELMNKALATTGSEYQSVEQFITDTEDTTYEQVSQAFIDQLMNKNTTAHFSGKLSLVYHYSQERARHIAVTFLVGMVFAEFCGFYKSLPGILKCDDLDEDKKTALAQRMWLITSLSHDVGYGLEELLSDTSLVFERDYPRFLLTDTYQDISLQAVEGFADKYPKVFAHQYQQIIDYNKYIRKYKTWDPPQEKNDHGILGGVYMFDELARSIKKLPPTDRDNELVLVKACCMTVAQHNIFKSGGIDKYSGIDYDKLYQDCNLHHLLSTENFRIKNDTPLLLFLCLVDTIECMKRFSKGATKGKYLQAPTILEKISLYVDESKIVLDFTALKKHIDDREKGIEDADRELLPIYKKHLNAIKGFHTWTAFKAEPDPKNPNIIIITLDK